MIFCLIDPQVFWSDSGELCCIATEDSFYILKYNQEAASKGLENKDEFMTEDGIEEAFEVCLNIAVSHLFWMYTSGCDKHNS